MSVLTVKLKIFIELDLVTSFISIKINNNSYFFIHDLVFIFKKGIIKFVVFFCVVC